MAPIPVLEVELTPRQREVFGVIFASARDKGYQPTVREMQEQLGVQSPNGVMCHVRALAKKGYIKIGNNASRSVRILRKPDGEPFKGFIAK